MSGKKSKPYGAAPFIAQRKKAARVAVTYDDFAKLDIRIVRITSVEPIPGKTRIAKGTLDTGSGELSVIIGGVDKFDSASLVGRQAVAVVNLEPKSIAGVTSEAMLLAADVDGQPFWLEPGGQVPEGTRIK